MSVEEFDDNYFYAAELKTFARQLGIAVGRRRKLELEALIREFLRTGTVPLTKPEPDRRPGKLRDRLAAETIVRTYVDDRRTKAFLRDLVHAHVPQLIDKSGQWYWLNEWRRTQLRTGQCITYADLGNRLLELMRSEGRLPRIPAARFNNFVTDFWTDPANKDKTRADAVAAWECIKSVPGPKTYEAYAALEPSRGPEAPIKDGK
ncbi:MAG: hypothetical protein OXN18_16445 [Gemmatimonadota bacterium]|nr:hypothetical protein [Gemmatimonadota bacterium]